MTAIASGVDQKAKRQGAPLSVPIASRSDSRQTTNDTVYAALRRLGYTSDEVTGHGFRSLAYTSLNEQGYTLS